MTTMGGTKQTRPCRYCCEAMDVRARFCPHCQQETIRSAIGGEVRSLVFGVLFVLAISPLIFWLFTRTLENVGKHMFDGMSATAHAQPAHKAKPKAH